MNASYYNVLARAVTCPYCKATPGAHCIGTNRGPIQATHSARRDAANRWRREQGLDVPKRKDRVPRKALQAVYDMACEMSNSYQARDENGEELGTEPWLLKALEDVRSYFGLAQKMRRAVERRKR